MPVTSKLLDRSPFRFEDISFEKLIQVLTHIPDNATLRIGNVMMPDDQYIMKINGEWCLCVAKKNISDCRIEHWDWQNCIMDLETKIYKEYSHLYPDSKDLGSFEEYKRFNGGWHIDFDLYYKYPISGVIKAPEDKEDNEKPQIHLTSEPMRFMSVLDVDKIYAYAHA